MLKKLVAFVAVVALLAACDRAEPIKQTRDTETFTVTLHLMDADKISQFCKELGVTYEANGCSAFREPQNTCDIYVAPQRFEQDEERLTIIGHEVWHCRFGRWHD